jgi:hypothetical protein
MTANVAVAVAAAASPCRSGNPPRRRIPSRTIIPPSLPDSRVSCLGGIKTSSRPCRRIRIRHLSSWRWHSDAPCPWSSSRISPRRISTCPPRRWRPVDRPRPHRDREGNRRRRRRRRRRGRRRFRRRLRRRRTPASPPELCRSKCPPRLRRRDIPRMHPSSHLPSAANLPLRLRLRPRPHRRRCRRPASSSSSSRRATPPGAEQARRRRPPSPPPPTSSCCAAASRCVDSPCEASQRRDGRPSARSASANSPGP